MSLTVFSAVILAALLHALWNAAVKGGADKHLAMSAVVLGHLPPALLFLPFVPLPSLESLPYLLAGTLLHMGYQIFLLQSYRIGDLTQVYPIARGSAPLLVALISLTVLGVQLDRLQILAVVCIGLGIMSISLVRQRDGLKNWNATILALCTGCFIAGYSLVDGLGARAFGSALGFFAWLTMANAPLFALFTAITKPGVLSRLPLHGKRIFLIGGNASFAAYSLVVWAFTQAPIALVTALRETSIIFALLIGVFVLKERIDLAKVFSTLVTLIGVALLRFAKS